MSEWIEWKGGDRPVGWHTKVDYKLVGIDKVFSDIAGHLRWGDAEGAEIVLYRPSEQQSMEEAYEQAHKEIGGSEYETAPTFLKAAAKHMDDRAATYDKPEGERSITQVVAIFNQFHGTNLTEAQGWHFMEIVKQVRFFTKEGFHRDSAEDSIAYAALRAEAKQREGK